jgi:hypothetical protein
MFSDWTFEMLAITIIEPDITWLLKGQLNIPYRLEAGIASQHVEDR